MPRGPRLDHPGALHHIIVRGIERRQIFRTDRDRRGFLDRLSALSVAAAAPIYAFALMPNHAHVLIRTGSLSISRLVQRWLASYATDFNRRRRRSGHLFQNRFKSILVEEDRYLLELVRYIHLNPVRSRLAVTLDDLDCYPWTGHSVVLGRSGLNGQDVDFVLSHFGGKVREARDAYQRFVREGYRHGAPDLDGGGLRRSAGGWKYVRTLGRGRERWAFDERILGSPDFVEAVLIQREPRSLESACDSEEILNERCRVVGEYFGVSIAELTGSSMRRSVLDARAVLCHIGVCVDGFSSTTVARRLGVSRYSVARSLRRAPAVYALLGHGPEHFA